MKAQLNFASGFALALAMVAAPAYGQTARAPKAEGETAAGDGEGGLAEIVVTAQKREEKLQRAAISVSVVTADTLTQKGVSDATQLSSIVPALQIGSSYGGGSQFTLRGIGNLVLNVNSDTAVITNIDGVPIGRATSVQGLFYDLERVEVLKGPQGTLYGRNATGGAINVITAKPKFDETSGYLNASYGNYDTLGVDAAVNLPVGKSATVRIAGTLKQHSGYYSDGSGDERQRAGRATFKAELSDAVRLTVSGDYAWQGGVGDGGTFFGNDKDARIGILDSRTSPILAGTFSIPAFAFLAPLTGITPRQNNEMWGVAANLEVGTSLGTVSVIPAYRRASLDFETVAPGFYAANKERDEQKTLEVRLVSPSSNRLQYILGAFYMDERNEVRIGYNQQIFEATGTFIPHSKALADYGRLTYGITPAFRVSLAGRYTSDKRTNDQVDVINGITFCSTEPPIAPFNPATNSPCIGTPPFPYTGLVPPSSWPIPPAHGTNVVFYPSGGLTTVTSTPFHGERTFNKFNWRAGLEYDVGPRSLLYATVETGFKAGGFYNSTNPDPSYGPETVTSYTLGSKNRFLDNRLQLNLEAFWVEYSNKQFSLILPQQDGSLAFTTLNVGKSRARGFEIEALGKATDTTTLNLNVQYLDAKETNFKYTAFGGLPITGCPFAPGSPGTFNVDCSGQTSVNSPQWTINAGIEQIIPLANRAEIKIDAQTRYQSRMQTSYDFLPGGIQDGYTMSDIYLTYEAPEDKYYITGFVSNIENTAASTYSQFRPGGTIAPAPINGPLLRYSLTPPRTYGVRVGVKF